LVNKEMSMSRSITIKCNGIRYLKEDDPFSRDEPYLVTVGFRCRVAIDGSGKARVVPGSLTTRTVGGGPQNNLGRSKDNWAKKGNTYYYEGRMTYATSVPKTQAGWLVGTVVIFMEEDGWSNSLASHFRAKVHEVVRGAIANLSMSGFNTSTITDAIVKKITADLGKALLTGNIVGIVKNLIAAVDPDDFGGVNLVMAATLPGGLVQMYAGQPPANITGLSLKNVPLNSPVGFELAYPIGALGSIPKNARYMGGCRILGNVSQSVT
jgi:hypothetical protein